MSALAPLLGAKQTVATNAGGNAASGHNVRERKYEPPERVMPGADVAAIAAAQTDRFKMPDQRTITGTRLGKATDTAKMRNQRPTAARGVG